MSVANMLTDAVVQAENSLDELMLDLDEARNVERIMIAAVADALKAQNEAEAEVRELEKSCDRARAALEAARVRAAKSWLGVQE